MYAHDETSAKATERGDVHRQLTIRIHLTIWKFRKVAVYTEGSDCAGRALVDLRPNQQI
jgi:hypothetical protein